MVKIYIYISDPNIRGIYKRRTRQFYVSTNPYAVNGVVYITD